MSDEILNEITAKEYEFGFTTNIETDKAPAGLNEDIIRLISSKKKNRNGCFNGGWKLLLFGKK
jgi:hypothetical protein